MPAQIDRQRQDARVGEALADGVPVVLRAAEHVDEHDSRRGTLRRLEDERLQRRAVVGAERDARGRAA